MLAVVGFGTKMGLFPVHTWLPDAHSEAPTPVSALLSGSLLAVSFYAILRYYQVAAAALGPGFPRDVLLVFGVASLLLAALYLLDQRDVKRMLAYSSVEHMGILAIGVSFGAPIALAGVLLHVLAHAAAKGNAFMGAGVLVHKFGSKRISGISGGLDLLPWSGPLFGIAILALCAMPPFGIFRSEFEIVEGGFSSARYATPAVLIVLVTLERDKGRIVDDLVSKLRAAEEVIDIWYVTGDHDLVLHVAAQNMSTYDAFTRRALHGEEHVRSFKTLVVLQQPQRAAPLVAAGDADACARTSSRS